MNDPVILFVKPTGSHESMAELNGARDQALREVGA